MPAEERSLTSGALLEETKSPEIGQCLSTPLSDSAVTEGTLLTREDIDALGVTTEITATCRVLVSEASRKAGCGKSARPV